MADPQRLMPGAHLNLRKVRDLTFTPGQPIPVPLLIGLTEEAARVTAMSPGERMAYAFERSWEPAWSSSAE